MTTPISTSSPPAKNRILLTAATLAALIELLHIFGGGVTVVRPLIDSSLVDESRLVLYAVWHMVSLVIGFSAIALFVAALPRYAAANRNLAIFISLLWISFGLSFIGVAIAEGGNLLTTLNQPFLLIPVGLLGLWGSTENKQVHS